MKCVCIIPSRYGSSRFPGKPLAIINGKPMIYWVWNNCKKVSSFSDVIVATDDNRIQAAAESFGARVIMTSPNIDSPTERVRIVSHEVDADFYVMVNGDEPLLTPNDVSKCVPEKVDPDEILVMNLMTECLNPVDVVDVTNIKIVTNEKGEGIYISRTPIPYPKGTSDFTYLKFVGVTGFTRPALEFFHDTPRGNLEKIEDVDELRFIEHGKKVLFVNAHCRNLSVDTVKDLQTVEKKMTLSD